MSPQRARDTHREHRFVASSPHFSHFAGPNSYSEPAIALPSAIMSASSSLSAASAEELFLSRLAWRRKAVLHAYAAASAHVHAARSPASAPSSFTTCTTLRGALVSVPAPAPPHQPTGARSASARTRSVISGSASRRSRPELSSASVPALPAIVASSRNRTKSVSTGSWSNSTSLRNRRTRASVPRR